MVRKLLRKVLRKPLTALANRFDSAPQQEPVHRALHKLWQRLQAGQPAAGPTIHFPMESGRFIIFSDQHKGIRDAADDFRDAAPNYNQALDYYFAHGFTLINNGDAEELWENKPAAIIPKNQEALAAEARFVREHRYYRTYGNHDLEWKYEWPRRLYLYPVLGRNLRITEAVVLQTRYREEDWSILVTHGHQGDSRSDGNTVSQWLVAALWTPVQRFLDININTTAGSFEKINLHNKIMNAWSDTRKNLILISGHTHKPVFGSIHYPEYLRRQKDLHPESAVDPSLRSTYFNSGCCCFDNGAITGIEIAGGVIRLIQWSAHASGSLRTVLQESPLSRIFDSAPAPVVTPEPVLKR